MTTLTFSESPSRPPLAMLASIMIHCALVTAILYASYHHVRQEPEVSQPLSVTLMAPEVQSQPESVVASLSEPESQPESQPEVSPPVTVPETPKSVSIPLSKPVPKPKPIKKETVKETVKELTKSKRMLAESKQRPQDPFGKNQSTSQMAGPPDASKANPSPVKSVSTGPMPLITGKPRYPTRAYALRIEGDVQVAYDVNSEGRVENIRILSAKPQNMFEREVKQAMRKWRYQPGRPGQNLNKDIQFRFDGGINLK